MSTTPTLETPNPKLQTLNSEPYLAPQTLSAKPLDLNPKFHALMYGLAFLKT